MTTGSGIFKQVAYKQEVTYGLIPAAAGAQLVRRVTSSLDMTKDTYQSNEIRTDFQIMDFRHGVRKVGGTINGELSAKTYGDFIAAALKKAWTVGVTTVAASLTIAASGSPQTGDYTITRATGSYLTDGIKAGDVVRLTVGTFAAVNKNKNLLVTAVSATNITVDVCNGSTLTAEGPITTAQMQVMGRKTMVPQTGHTDLSYSIEHWFADVPTSEVFSGCKVSKVSVSLPSTGMATIAVDFVGKDCATQATQFFTTPTALTTTGCMAAVNGILVVNNVRAANVTGMTIDIAAGQSGEAVVGQNTIPFQAAGRVVVSGQLTLTFSDTVMRDAFFTEAEMSLFAVFTENNLPDCNVMGFNIPRFKAGGAGKDDGEKTLTLTVPFQALLNAAGGTGMQTDLTTIAIQDSAL